MKCITTTILLLISSFLYCTASETIYFKSNDGIQIAADIYMTHPKSAPFIVLFHQANSSRGEYNEIAPRLNSMGFNCMSVDLRAGGSINDINNITHKNALKAMKETQYINALPDMIAAVNYARNHFAEEKLIIWGSSYSAALSIRIAGEMVELVDAVMAFSPGEYFNNQGKPRNYVTDVAININKPVFITSAKNEKNSWWGIYVTIPSKVKEYYLPEEAGNHGSKALWSKFSESEGYWKAVSQFLSNI